jgi:hypothetical protein
MGAPFIPESRWTFSGGALPCEARRDRIMKWHACGAPATPYHRPLQPIVMRLAQHRTSLSVVE